MKRGMSKWTQSTIFNFEQKNLDLILVLYSDDGPEREIDNAIRLEDDPNEPSNFQVMKNSYE